MTAQVITAGAALAEVLARENAALAALQLGQAAAALDAKQAASAAFAAAVAQAKRHGGLAEGDRAAAARLGARLQELAAENRRLLERALTVQGRVLETIARALPRALPAAPRYGRCGLPAHAERAPALAFAARA